MLPDRGLASAPAPSYPAFVLVALEPAQFRGRLGPHRGLLTVLGYPNWAEFIFEGMHTKIEVLEMAPVWFLSLLD